MAGPALVRNLTVPVDGAVHRGTYYVQSKMVYVQYGGETKVTQVGGSSPVSIARLLLSEMVREQRP